MNSSAGYSYPSIIGALYVADQIPHELYLIGFTRGSPACKFILQQDRQLNDLDQVESQIFAEVRVIVYGLDINADVLRDIGADFSCQRSFFQSRDARAQCQAGHADTPQSVEHTTSRPPIRATV